MSPDRSSAPDRALAAAALLVSASGLLSRLFGVLRDRLLAGEFGAGSALDVYYAAFRLPDLVYNLLIVGALTAGLVPALAAARAKDGEEGAWKLAGQALTAVGVVLALASLVLGIAAPWLVPLTVSGFDPAQQELVVDLTRILALSPILLGLSAVMGGALQSLGRFVAFAVAPVLYNLGIIAGTLWFAPTMGIAGVAWGVVLGAGAHLILQAVAARRAGPLRFRAVTRPWPAGLLSLAAHAPPRVAGLAAAQFVLVVLLAFASGMAPGSVAVFTFANNLQAVPLGLIAVPYAVAAFPMFAAAAAEGDRRRLAADVGRALRRVLFFSLPALAVMYLLRAQVVRLLLGAGAFDWDATIRTAQALAAFLPSVLAQGAVAVLARASFALQDTRTPFYAAVVSSVVAIGVAMVARPLGPVGLALAFTTSTFINAAWLGMVLRRHLGGLGGWSIVETCLKGLAASAAIIAAGFPIRDLVGTLVPLRTFWEVALQAGAAGTVGVVAFCLVSWTLRSAEFLELGDALVSRLSSARRRLGGLEEARDVS